MHVCVCVWGGVVSCVHACVYVHAADRNLIPTRELSSRAQAGVPGARPESCCCAPVETMWGISLEQSPVKATLDQCCAGKCLTSSLGEKKKKSYSVAALVNFCGAATPIMANFRLPA